jgi:tRNA threonylcarbamoyladenosine biosynthesis protein TsaE
MDSKVKRLDGPAGPPSAVVIRTGSPGQTAALGRRLGRILPAGTTLSLEGGLGAGKTALVKGIATGLGIVTEVLSPTFILVEEYRGGEIPLLHYDLYRLEELGEVEKIGMFDAVDGRNIVVVEWGDRLPEGTMEFDVTISIRMTGSEEREIEVRALSGIIDAIEGWEDGR